MSEEDFRVGPRERCGLNATRARLSRPISEKGPPHRRALSLRLRRLLERAAVLDDILGSQIEAGTRHDPVAVWVQ